MVLVSLGPILRPVLGEARVKPLIDRALKDILEVFAKDDQKVVYEVLDAKGNPMPGRPGQIVNPGHAIEATWFCMEEGLHRKDKAIVNRAATICDWMYDKGHDREYGGLFGFCSPDGNQPPGAEQIAPWGERWDDKVWWVHSEALYATLLSAITRDDANAFSRFLELHHYTQRWFVDPEFGEWYEYLHRHGTPRSPLKGSWIKCAFHVPRNLIRVVHLLENPQQYRL
jgi:N-acylglucosamine 2-epimerase